MTIAELGSSGEFAGSIAVLITLVYLAIQVRQNTRHVQAQMGHDGWVSVADYELAQMGDAAAEALAKAYLDPNALTDKDLKIVDAHFRSLLMHMGRVEHMNSSGLEIYSVEQTAQAFIDNFNSQVGKAWWESSRFIVNTLAPKIGERMEELLDDPDLASRSESFKSFCQLTSSQVD
jgi:hypothetical protein